MHKTHLKINPFSISINLYITRYVLCEYAQEYLIDCLYRLL